MAQRTCSRATVHLGLLLGGGICGSFRGRLGLCWLGDGHIDLRGSHEVALVVMMVVVMAVGG